MQLEIIVGGYKLLALVDSGSTHCFLAADTAARLAIPVGPARQGMRVTVANGEKLDMGGHVRALSVSIQGEEFIISCYTLPLSGFDLVLGVSWLETLGPITWDFGRLTMEFWRATHRVHWQGSPTGGLAVRSAVGAGEHDLMQALLEDYADLFQAPRGLPPARACDHRIVLKTGVDAVSELRRHHLVLKRPKCLFGVSSVSYLGHVILAAGVAMDRHKVAAVADWPTPRMVRAVRGFLCLAGYYRRFVCNYGSVAAPLTNLLKKEAFRWLTKSDFREPVNIGSDEMVSMNEMAELVLSFENKQLPIHHIPGPEGVRGRNSDNTLIKEKLGWAPTMKLKDGLRITYFWIKEQLEKEKAEGVDLSAYGSSKVVQTQAPVQLGSLRAADGKE
ncbi:hypothetical protein E2562_029585 [Oryza meyeriana var. granulata]|uniref:NAD-dependent epimerase/dehydratase domain-containing protein n=1 Tax=Oryza meyeriana var. granulata TaxID=110450 RepID=A0A6G1CA76_9ORYZ|nr:hypothetical protein E2562_029585 [Oryza meyeriana var. granulata]